MATLKDILALLVILACYGIAGRMDYDDAVRQEEYMRGRSVEGHACTQDLSKTAEAQAVEPGDVAEAEADRDCETTPF
ncbi:hypothetical protein [Ottowia sp.]|jgi:hypothetical protein|uniref:hypothetical protein n=1 Tax=Ottowia sp. TaxID=1898956 RepID=UPI0026223D6F|nr:hypothetical protein [Ottowia sp.]